MSLKDELLKANLINKKQLKKIEHEQRVERSKNGHAKMQQKTFGLVVKRWCWGFMMILKLGNLF